MDRIDMEPSENINMSNPLDVMFSLTQTCHGADSENQTVLEFIHSHLTRQPDEAGLLAKSHFGNLFVQYPGLPAVNDALQDTKHSVERVWQTGSSAVRSIDSIADQLTERSLQTMAWKFVIEATRHGSEAKKKRLASTLTHDLIEVINEQKFVAGQTRCTSDPQLWVLGRPEHQAEDYLRPIEPEETRVPFRDAAPGELAAVF